MKRAARQGLLHRLDLAKLVRLVKGLEHALAEGKAVGLADGETMESDSYATIAGALDACKVCLHLLSAKGMHKQLLSEDLIELVLDVFKHQMNHSVFVHLDLEARQRGSHADWRISNGDMTRTARAHFMHCLPVRRGVVVDGDVLDGDRAAQLLQAEYRLHAQKAILELVWGLEGSGFGGQGSEAGG